MQYRKYLLAQETKIIYNSVKQTLQLLARPERVVSLMTIIALYNHVFDLWYALYVEWSDYFGSELQKTA